MKLILLSLLGVSLGGGGPLSTTMHECIVSKYEYRQHRGADAKRRFLAQNCGCKVNGPLLRDGQEYRNPYTCHDYECSCPEGPKLLKRTQWEYEFEGCQSWSSGPAYFSNYPDHCKPALENCEPVLVERRDGSPCQIGPNDGGVTMLGK